MKTSICKEINAKNVNSNWLDFEVEPNERKDEAFQVLHEIVEGAQAVRIARLLHVRQRSDLRGGERDMPVTEKHLELLPANSVWRGPIGIVLREHFTFLNHSTDFGQHSRRHESLSKTYVASTTEKYIYLNLILNLLIRYLFADHRIVFIIAIICISQLSCSKRTNE